MAMRFSMLGSGLLIAARTHLEEDTRRLFEIVAGTKDDQPTAI